LIGNGTKASICKDRHPLLQRFGFWPVTQQKNGSSVHADERKKKKHKSEEDRLPGKPRPHAGRQRFARVCTAGVRLRAMPSDWLACL
jgi:hypothetical protein